MNDKSKNRPLARTITRTFATIKEAEHYQQKLYARYDYVRLIGSPRFNEYGKYTWDCRQIRG